MPGSEEWLDLLLTSGERGRRARQTSARMGGALSELSYSVMVDVTVRELGEALVEMRWTVIRRCEGAEGASGASYEERAHAMNRISRGQSARAKAAHAEERKVHPQTPKPTTPDSTTTMRRLKQWASCSST